MDDITAVEAGVEQAEDDALLRGLQDARMAASGTTVGGYAQIQAGWLGVGPDPRYEGTASVRRLVVFVSHDFDPQGLPMQFYAELEWSNAKAGDGEPGAAEVEQALLDWELRPDWLTLRTGLVLVPMGIINQWHEPPVFHGVDRPSVDTALIPTTWRELGVGLVGRPGVFRYELYAMTGLDPSGFDDAGIRGGRGSGAVAQADNLAFAGRLEAEPALGLVLGASGYASDAGAGGDWFDAAGERLDLSMPVIGAEADARWRDLGVEARAVGVMWWLPESDDLMEALREDGSPYFLTGADPVPTRMLGGYVELAYDVLHPLGSRHQLLPFARAEHYDTQAGVPEGYEANPERRVSEYSFGLSYRPISQVVFKADMQLRDRQFGDDEQEFNVGVGVMY